MILSHEPLLFGGKMDPLAINSRKNLRDGLILILVGFGINFLAQMSSDINSIKTSVVTAIERLERLEARIAYVEKKKS